jgi:excisionase family DNA binding protein
MESKEFFTTSELAKKLGISRIAVFKKIKNGAIKAQKIGRNFVIYKNDIEAFSNDLFKLAYDWAVSDKKFPEEFYCQNSSVFQDRLIKMENSMIKNEATKNIFSLIVSIAGEIGDNSFAHNLGQWPDVPGIFFGYNLNKKQVVLVDRGLGILKTLKRVKPDLKNHKQALEVAFTEIISGRAPEARGNGLKYVRKIISENNIDLLFQSGDAKLQMSGKSPDLKIINTADDFHGCLALISF